MTKLPNWFSFAVFTIPGKQNNGIQMHSVNMQAVLQLIFYYVCTLYCISPTLEYIFIFFSRNYVIHLENMY